MIRAVVRKGVDTYGHDFVGFRDGWRGPLEGLTKPLGIAEVRGILPRGGTILGSSRTNPFKIDAILCGSVVLRECPAAGVVRAGAAG